MKPYIIIKEEHLRTLEDKVIDHLNRGFTLVGGPFPAMYRDINGWEQTEFCQAMKLENGSTKQLSASERISLEKHLDRVEDEIVQLKNQASHDAFGPKYSKEAASKLKELKHSRSAITSRLSTIAHYLST